MVGYKLLEKNPRSATPPVVMVRGTWIFLRQMNRSCKCHSSLSIISLIFQFSRYMCLEPAVPVTLYIEKWEVGQPSRNEKKEGHGVFAKSNVPTWNLELMSNLNV